MKTCDTCNSEFQNTDKFPTTCIGCVEDQGRLIREGEFLLDSQARPDHDTDPSQQIEKFKVFFSGGPGTYPERYQVGELFETREKAEAYIKMYDHAGAIWTIETVLV